MRLLVKKRIQQLRLVHFDGKHQSCSVWKRKISMAPKLWHPIFGHSLVLYLRSVLLNLPGDLVTRQWSCWTITYHIIGTIMIMGLWRRYIETKGQSGIRTKEVACREICPRDFLGHVGVVRLLKGQGLKRFWESSRTSICSIAEKKRRGAEYRQIPLVCILLFGAKCTHATRLLASWSYPFLFIHFNMPLSREIINIQVCRFHSIRIFSGNLIDGCWQGWTSRKPGIMFPYWCLEMSSHALSTGRRKLLEYAPCRAWVGSVGGAYRFANVTRRGSMAWLDLFHTALPRIRPSPTAKGMLDVAPRLHASPTVVWFVSRPEYTSLK